jgi:O-methyltransferase domain
LRQSLARGGVGFGTAAWGNNSFLPLLARTRKTFAKVHAIGGVYPLLGVSAISAKLLVIEIVIPPGNEASYSKLLDLMMLVGPGGCDRTEAEYEALFQAGGFKLTKVIPTQSPASVIEGIPE